MSVTTSEGTIAPTSQSTVVPPLLGDAIATFAMGFCAVTPVKGSPLVWPLLMAMVLYSVIRNRGRLVHTRFSLPLLAFVGWMWLSLLWSVEPAKTATELGMNLNYIFLGLIVAVNRSVFQIMELLSRAATWLLLACWAVAFAIPSIGRMNESDYAGTMRGLFIEKNQLGYFSVIAFITGVALALGPRRNDHRLRRWGPPAVAMSTVLGSTSKTALGVCLASIVITWIMNRLTTARRPLTLPLLGYLSLVLGLVVTVIMNWATILNALGRDATLTGRTEIWALTIDLIKERPLFGFGWKALWIDGSPTTMHLWALHYGVAFYHAHNGYLDLAAQLGLVGAVLAVFYLLSILVKGAVRFFADPTPVTSWPVVLVLVVMLYNATEVVAFTNTTWLVLVALSSIIRTTRKEELCISPTQPA